MLYKPFVLPVLNIYHTLGIRVTKVGVMGRTIVDHSFINWIGSLVGKDTSRQAGHNLFNSQLITAVQDIVIYLYIFSLKYERRIT